MNYADLSEEVKRLSEYNYLLCGTRRRDPDRVDFIAGVLIRPTFVLPLLCLTAGGEGFDWGVQSGVQRHRYRGTMCASPISLCVAPSGRDDTLRTAQHGSHRILTSKCSPLYLMLWSDAIPEISYATW